MGRAWLTLLWWHCQLSHWSQVSLGLPNVGCSSSLCLATLVLALLPPPAVPGQGFGPGAAERAVLGLPFSCHRNL